MKRIVRVVLAAAGSACLCAAAPGLAWAKVHIAVNLDTQTMHVDAGDKTFDWKVSSGKPGYETPPGKYGVLWMDKEHHSDEYDQAYMPNAIFFAPGYAIHGFGKSPWGHRASHGCIRLPTDKAAMLFGLVQAQGADVTVTGGPPGIVAKYTPRPPREDAAGTDNGPYAPEEARGYGAQSYGAQGYDDRGYAAQPSYGQQPGYGQDPGYGGQPAYAPQPAQSSLFGSVY